MGLLGVVERDTKHLVRMPCVVEQVDEGLILPGEYAFVLHVV